MPRTSEDTSMICLLWLDADNNPYLTQQPGTRQCGGITHVEHTLPFNGDINGKKKHRICQRCGHGRDAVESWTDIFWPGRIDAESKDTRPVLPGFDD